ncbi:MAG: D-erythro-7,8-dihydroneopterin triphosphate epimerase [Candidatus Cloacimonadota bacterium]|nr:MAG: D-erythro-7,8-dihydroneopterin triphosphate epimerase [Candidatus Cloacimonadota bacterium]PIE77951.1 MAG: D-erythro-7,8-dihydroneopterin triphosphate epimerase [Candidatus Delongbacteria bacterium]
MGTIKLKKIRARTIIGCMGIERVEKQDILINLEVKYDSTKASLSDNVEDSLNYKDLEGKVVEFVENSDFHILERLSRAILEFILQDSRIKWSSIEIEKPKALKFCDTVSYSITSDDI